MESALVRSIETKNLNEIDPLIMELTRLVVIYREMFGLHNREYFNNQNIVREALIRHRDLAPIREVTKEEEDLESPFRKELRRKDTPDPKLLSENSKTAYKIEAKPVA